MSFVSMLKAGPLPEKPWKAGAVVRLAGGVLVSMLIGAAVAMVFRYFAMPQKSSALLFLMYVAAAMIVFVVAIVLLIRPWPVEDFLPRLLGVLLSIYGGFLLMWLAGRLTTDKTDVDNPILMMLIAVLTFQGAALILVNFFLREHGTNWREGFGLANGPALAIALGIGAGLLAVFPAWELQAVSAWLFERLSLHPKEQEAVEILRNTEGLTQRVALAIATIFIAPAGEEVLFRGILYPAIKRTGRPQLALWFTALLFGAIHFNLASFIPLTLLAVLLIWLYELTGNLLTCFAVHCVFNTANFIALYFIQK